MADDPHVMQRLFLPVMLLLLVAGAALVFLRSGLLDGEGVDGAASDMNAPSLIAASDSTKGKKVAVLTSLPLFAPEAYDIADRLSKDTSHPFGDILAEHYGLQVHDVLEPALADKPELLIMAQARPMAPDELVALDDWLREGGQALIFADPSLHWPSIFPYGDPRRPEGATLLSPLFAHWGLEEQIDQDQPHEEWLIKVGDHSVPVIQAGHFVPQPTDTDDSCTLRAKALIADCRISKGRVWVVADADLLQPDIFAHETVTFMGTSPGSGEAVIGWIDMMLGERKIIQ